MRKLLFNADDVNLSTLQHFVEYSLRRVSKTLFLLTKGLETYVANCRVDAIDFRINTVSKIRHNWPLRPIRDCVYTHKSFVILRFSFFTHKSSLSLSLSIPGPASPFVSLSRLVCSSFLRSLFFFFASMVSPHVHSMKGQLRGSC